MKIDFQDDEHVVVTIKAWVVNEDSGEVVEEGSLVYSISLDIGDDPDYAPRLRHCEKVFKFPHKDNRDYGLSTVSLGLDTRYRMDDDCSQFSLIMENVEEEWWAKYGQDHFDWTPASYEDPGYWRSRQ